MLSSFRIFRIYFITVFYQPNPGKSDIQPNIIGFWVPLPPFMDLLTWYWQCNDLKPENNCSNNKSVRINPNTTDKKGQLPEGLESGHGTPVWEAVCRLWIQSECALYDRRIGS